MTVRAWIDELEMTGHTTFSLENAASAFPSLEKQVLQNNLMRLKNEKRIVSVYRRFYVIMPVRYKSRGIIPPTYYLPELMRFLGRPYYFGLLTAAKVWGASHQMPLVDFATTTYPALNSSKNMNASIHWCYRYKMPVDFLVERNDANGTVLYSSPELTAVELVQYARHCGGLSNVATVLAELSDSLDFGKLPTTFFEYCKGTSIQRLGYILDEVLGAKDVANALCEQWKANCRVANTCLNVESNHDVITHNRRWHINVNEKLEVDDL